MSDYFRLVRWKNLIIIGFTQLFFLFLTRESFLQLTDIALILSTLLTAAAGYVINDFYDLETDKINKPEKVFIGKSIPKDHSRRFYFLLVILSLWIGYYSFGPATSYVLGINVLLFLYSYKLKKWPLVGNIIVSFCSSMVIFYLYISEPRIVPLLFSSHYTVLKTFTIFAFLITLVRELVKDMEDIKGDYKAKHKTLPIVAGIKATKVLASIFILGLLSFYLSVSMEFGENYLPFIGFGIVSLFSIFLLVKIGLANKKEDYSRLSTYCKILILVGLGTAVLWFV